MIIGVLGLVAGVAATIYAVQQLINPTTMLGMARLGDGLKLIAFAVRFVLSLGLISFGVWQIMLSKSTEPFTPQKGTIRTLGFCSLAGFAALVIMRYAEMPASVHNIIAISRLFAALAVLIYTNKLLGTLCVDFTPQYKCSLQKAAIFMFFMCVCICVPSDIWRVCNGLASILDMALLILFTIYSVFAVKMACENAD